LKREDEYEAEAEDESFHVDASLPVDDGMVPDLTLKRWGS
jgi:hypothetical protein